MTHVAFLRALPVAALTSGVLLAGCGGGDPLDGTWHASASVAGQASETLEITFNGDHTARLHSVQVNDAAASDQPGCTTTSDLTGFHWSTTATQGASEGTLSFDGTATMESLTRSGCTNASDDQGTITVTGDVPIGTFVALSGPYTVSSDGQSLTIHASAGSAGFTTTLTR